ncbi:MAG TPA: GNAT family N-acetyltransferase [Thermoanaerobaculia bacterium]|nr:GNAT family N-acetyltransferase [Thermoanaerobaculia bacterium]
MELATKRFLLRDFNDADTAAFDAYHSDPRSREFDGAEESGPGYARELLVLFKTWAAAKPRMNYQLAIVQRSVPHALVGCCGVRCADSEPGTGELGIELAPEYWGRYAYAIEVMRALVEFGFGVLGLQVIYGETVSANSRVARLVRSVGAMAVVRPTPDWMVVKGWTQIEWRITREQWERVRLTRPYSGPPPASAEL